MHHQQLSIEVVWKDEHMIQVEVCVSNGAFFGTNRFYDSADYYLELASELQVFSNSYKNDSKITFTKGDDLFSISANFSDNLGHISICVSLQQLDAITNNVENSVKLTAITDLVSVDSFCKELEDLGTKQSGIARLGFIAT